MDSSLHGRRLQVHCNRLIKVLFILLMIYLEGVDTAKYTGQCDSLAQGRWNGSLAVRCASEDGLSLLEIDDSRLLDHVERWLLLQ